MKRGGGSSEESDLVEAAAAGPPHPETPEHRETQSVSCFFFFLISAHAERGFHFIVLIYRRSQDAKGRHTL